MLTQTYSIDGMTCQNCVAHVKKALLAHPHIDEVEIDLTNKSASISASRPLAAQDLAPLLPARYTLRLPALSAAKPDAEPRASKWQQLKPLFLILTYITVASILLHLDDGNWRGAMLDFMGIFLIVFSFFKILDLRGFPASFAMYDPLAKRLPAYGWAYPFIETALGLMFLFRYEVRWALIITLVLLSITTIGVVQSLMAKRQIKCACLGTALNLPMTEATFIENAIMIGMGLTMLLS